MRADIISRLEEMKELSHVFVLTHNIDFIFIQTVFLSALKKCGHPKLTVIADPICADESYSAQLPVVSGLGTRYRLSVPQMPLGFRFHPKAVLAIGKDRSVLFVGSGNLTFGGYRENFEIWSEIEAAENTKDVFGRFREFLRSVFSQLGDREQVDEELASALNPRKHEWASDLPTEGPLHHAMAGQVSLLNQMQSQIDSSRLRRIIVSTPYFDEAAVALTRLAEAFTQTPVTVLLQSRRSTLFRTAADKLPGNVSLQSIAPAGTEKDAIGRFIHAKYFAFELDENVVVFSGSANCSIAALLKSDQQGNVELLVRREFSHEEFTELFTDEFEMREESPELLDPAHEDEESTLDTASTVTIISANWDNRALNARYTAPHDIEIVSCLIDDDERTDFDINDEVLIVNVGDPPRRLQLKSRREKAILFSNKVWINNEDSLRATATRRSIGDIISSSGRSGIWKLADWTLILDRLTDDFEETGHRYVDKGATKARKDDQEALRFTREDVFAADYAVHQHSRTPIHSTSFEVSTSVLSMLLHSFGAKVEEDSDVDSEDTHLDLDVADDNYQSNESVDRPKSASFAKRQEVNTDEPTTRELHKVQQLVNTIAKQVSSDAFVFERSPKRLREDLEIVAILLRLVLSKGWLNQEQFLDMTHQVFANLLLADDSGAEGGLLASRYRLSEDPEAFASSFCSTQLSGALLAWAIAGASEEEQLKQLRFRFAQWLSAGRIPWLWQGGSHEEILSVVATLLSQIPCSAIETNLTLADVEAFRIDLIQKGTALHALESALRRETLAAIRELVSIGSLNEGDLLWQGRRGYCLVQGRSGRSDIHVYCINDEKSDATFRQGYVLPIRSVLRSTEALSRLSLSTPIIDTLARIISELSPERQSD